MQEHFFPTSACPGNETKTEHVMEGWGNSVRKELNGTIELTSLLPTKA